MGEHISIMQRAYQSHLKQIVGCKIEKFCGDGDMSCTGDCFHVVHNYFFPFRVFFLDPNLKSTYSCTPLILVLLKKKQK